MKIILVVFPLLAAPVAAQTFTTTPNVPFHPEYGSTTRTPQGVFTTNPTIMGQPQWGSITTTPNNHTCRTTPNIFGHPEYGSTTTCN